MGVFPLTPVQVKLKREEKAKMLKDADDQVEALKRALEKKLMMNLKKVEQKIVLQHQQIVDGKENLKSLEELHKTTTAELRKDN